MKFLFHDYYVIKKLVKCLLDNEHKPHFSSIIFVVLYLEMSRCFLPCICVAKCDGGQ